MNACASTTRIGRWAATGVRGLLLAVVLCVPPVRGAGLTRDYLTDVWTSDDGLPDNSVIAVAQTPDGYLWIGTYNGLARFDGVRFVSFDPANTLELMHARIRKLYVDHQGTLWINTYDGSLTTYRQGKFVLQRRRVRSSEGEVTLVSSSSNQIVFLMNRGELLRKSLAPWNSHRTGGQNRSASHSTGLAAPPDQGWEELPPPGRGLGAICCADGDGKIWYRDGDKRLWRLAGERFELVPDAGTNINCLTTDAEGHLWAGTDNGFEFWDGNKFQDATPTNFNSRMANAPAESQRSQDAGVTRSVLVAPLDVTSLAVAPGGRVWAVANGCVCEAAIRRWLLAPTLARRVFTGEFGPVGMQPDHQGGMWFYNYGRGLIHVTAAGGVRPLTPADGFSGDRVYCFIQDREGDWWAGLDASGLVRIRESQFHAVGPEDELLAKAAKSVCQDMNGAVWIGLLSGGLERWQNGQLTHLPAPDGNALGSVFCLCPDARGQLWASAGNEDLYVRSPAEGGHFRRVSPVLHGVKAILADRAGRIWAGTTSGLFVSNDGSPEDFQPFKDILWHNVRALAEDRAGGLWAGTGNGELFHVISNTVTAFHPTDRVESGAIWSVLADPDGTVWAGTFRGGLLRLRNGKFTRYRKKDGLPDNVISQILDDRRGNLWLGSHQGIFRISRSALHDFAAGKTKFVPGVAYGRSDGLPSTECSGGYQPSGWRDREGRLWFATAKGPAWIQPDEVKPNSIAPPVVIEEVLVDGVPVRSAGFGMWNSEMAALGSSPQLTIPPGKHQVEFRYTGLSLASPERVRFRYRLNGVNADWVLAGTRRFVQYNLLPAGDYHFRVIACNSDGVWNQIGAQVDVRILPHYYETWWFQTLAVVAVLGAVAGGARRLATRRLHRRMEELERRQAVERERARIAKDIHDDLGANLTLIAVLGDLAGKEKTGERIEKISGTAREAVKSLDEIVWAVNPRNDTLVHLVDYTGQFATNYLREAGVRCRLDVPDRMPACEVPANVRHNVFLVVKEALQNIVKHARATEVWLRIHPNARGMNLSVEDNGCGFDAVALAAGVVGAEADRPTDAWADGLRNMRQRLAEVGGECRIQSCVGAGTTITLELPLPPD